MNEPLDPARLFAFDGNFVVVASAGTGKTYTLVGVLVHLLLGASGLRGVGVPVDAGRIVATTFSRKAAAEIRQRVATALEDLAADAEDAPYRASVAAALGASERSGAGRVGRTNDVRRRARAALDGLARARIGTLHSFAQSLLRERALEVGLAPGFELLTEDDAAAQAEEVVTAELMRFAERDRRTARDLVRLAGGVDRLTEELARLAAQITELGVAPDALLAAQGDASEIERLVDEVVVATGRARDHKKHGAVAAHLVDVWARRDDAALEAALVAALTITKDKEPTLADFVDVREGLPGKNNEDRARTLFAAYRERAHFGVMAAAVRDLVAAIGAELAQKRRRASTLSFGDLMVAARDLLLLRPDVAAEVSDGLDALLVDEFQDTSRVQCELVRLLWEAEPRRRAPGALPAVGATRRAGLLVVGDRKQSIYGFRGADVGVFTEFCLGLAGLRAREQLRVRATDVAVPASPTASLVALRENWRSAPEVLEFANRFTSLHLKARGESLYEVDYAPEVEELVVPAARARAAAVASGQAAPRVSWLRPEEGTSSTRLDEARLVAAFVAERVGRAPDYGGPPRRYRDFAVLALTNQMLDTLAFALSRAEVPHVVAGRGFFSAREVRDAVALLAVLVRPRDRLAWATVLRSPWLGCTDRELLALTAPPYGLVAPLFDLGALPAAHLLDGDARTRIAERLAFLERLRRNVDRVPAAALLREAMRGLRLEEALVLLPRGAQRVSNVHKLLSVAERTPSARLLLRRLERAIEREVQETDAATFSDEDDAVRLLTVHASKGLAFPVVLVTQVGADRQTRLAGSFFLRETEPGRVTVATRYADATGRRIDSPSARRAKADVRARELAERRRLNYVAMTRAEEELVLVGKRKATAHETYDATPTAVLALMAEGRDASLAVRDLPAGGRGEVSAPAPSPALAPLVERAAAPVRATVVAVTPLVDFRHCPRRFQLAHLLDVPEELPSPLRSAPAETDGVAAVGDASLDARAEGTLLHALLERVPPSAFGAGDAERHAELALGEGGELVGEARRRVVARAVRFLGSEYARRVREAGAVLHREVPFVVRLDEPDADGEGAGGVGLRGAIDLVVAWPDGELDVLDYKRARGPSPEPYALQLDLYAVAARQLFGQAVARTGIVFLGASSPRVEPAFRGRPDLADVRAAARALMDRMRLARHEASFPREPPTTCQRIRCGYVSLCHPKAPLVQLGLFAPRAEG